MSTLTIRLDDSLQKSLDKESRELKLSRSQVVRQAILDFVKRREEKSYLNELIRAAKHRDPVHDRALAEEALEFDNEALSVAEGDFLSPSKTAKRPRRRHRS